jgi:hypothetical protein
MCFHSISLLIFQRQCIKEKSEEKMLYRWSKAGDLNAGSGAILRDAVVSCFEGKVTPNRVSYPGTEEIYVTSYNCN